MPDHASQSIEHSTQQQLLELGIHPNYTFSNFLTNSLNASWIDACKSAASIEDDSTPYSPLFIHGSVGSGKTHLSHAIANELFANGYQHIICKTGGAFCHELIISIHNGHCVAFREKYQQADALIIDEIDFIAGKHSTAQEFRHIYDFLSLQRKPLIMTANCPPAASFKQNELLRSRFTACQIVCIPNPDAATRNAYLQRRLSELHIELDTEFSDMLLSSLTSIRELQGAVNTLNAFVTLSDKPVGVSLIQQILNNHRLHTETEKIQ